MSNEDVLEFRDVTPFREIPFDHNEIAGAINTHAEKVSDLSKVLPNTTRELKEKLWRLTIPFELQDKTPAELILDLNEFERSINIQLRTGIDREDYPFEINFKKISKVEVRNNNSLQFTTEKGIVILVSPSSVNLSEED